MRRHLTCGESGRLITKLKKEDLSICVEMSRVIDQYDWSFVPMPLRVDNGRKPRVKRPLNAFMLWVQAARQKLADRYPRQYRSLHSAELSRTLAAQWNRLRWSDKKPFIQEAERLKKKHKEDYPEFCQTRRVRRWRRSRRGRMVATWVKETILGEDCGKAICWKTLEPEHGEESPPAGQDLSHPTSTSGKCDSGMPTELSHPTPPSTPGKLQAGKQTEDFSTIHFQDFFQEMIEPVDLSELDQYLPPVGPQKMVEVSDSTSYADSSAWLSALDLSLALPSAGSIDTTFSISPSKAPHSQSTLLKGV